VISESPEERAYVDRLKEARGGSAELKLKLIRLRADLPEVAIFVFEGNDDRSVYYNWVRYLRSEFRYEPFTCQGKGPVLSLKQAVDRDADGLGRNVYFFIDRDYDDSKGVALDDSLYMTDYYSVENYLVTAEVLEGLLKIEFHCHSEPAVRVSVINEFNRLYEEFLHEIVDVNELLHCARLTPVKLANSVPAGIGRIVSISLDDVDRSGESAFDFLAPVRAIEASEMAALASQFASLSPRERHRGKFSLSWFFQWLRILGAERVKQSGALFAGLSKEVKVSVDKISIATLAARSSPPQSFRDFFLAFADD
jgi:hypothetical protein